MMVNIWKKSVDFSKNKFLIQSNCVIDLTKEEISIEINRSYYFYVCVSLSLSIYIYKSHWIKIVIFLEFILLHLILHSLELVYAKQFLFHLANVFVLTLLQIAGNQTEVKHQILGGLKVQIIRNL